MAISTATTRAIAKYAEDVLSAQNAKTDAEALKLIDGLQRHWIRVIEPRLKRAQQGKRPKRTAGGP